MENKQLNGKFDININIDYHNDKSKISLKDINGCLCQKAKADNDTEQNLAEKIVDMHIIGRLNDSLHKAKLMSFLGMTVEIILFLTALIFPVRLFASLILMFYATKWLIFIIGFGNVNKKLSDNLEMIIRIGLSISSIALFIYNSCSEEIINMGMISLLPPIIGIPAAYFEYEIRKRIKRLENNIKAFLYIKEHPKEIEVISG